MENKMETPFGDMPCHMPNIFSQNLLILEKELPKVTLSFIILLNPTGIK